MAACLGGKVDVVQHLVEQKPSMLEAQNQVSEIELEVNWHAMSTGIYVLPWGSVALVGMIATVVMFRIHLAGD